MSEVKKSEIWFEIWALLKRIINWIKQFVMWIYDGIKIVVHWLKQLYRFVKKRLQNLQQQMETKDSAYYERSQPQSQENHATEVKNRAETAKVIAEDTSPIVPVTLDPTVPQNRAELLDLIKNAPISLLSLRERKAFQAIMELDQTTVSELMIPAKKLIYVSADEVLGPLTLDRLYQSGLTYFPVKNQRGEITGLINTSRLNALEIKETSTAAEFQDQNVNYVREDYPIDLAWDTLLKTDSKFCLVVDRYGKVVGAIELAKILEWLFGKVDAGTFLNDSDPLAVAKRILPISLEQKDA